MMRALLNTRIGEPGPIDAAKPYKTRTRRLSKQWLKVKAGDFLWVRETWQDTSDDPPWVMYAADSTMRSSDGIERGHLYQGPWRPSIFMPRHYCRIRLQATEDARPEHLHDITEEEAMLEGVKPWYEADLRPDGELREGPSQKYRAGFMDLWQSLHREPGETWEENPELVRIAFRRVEVRP